MSTSPWHMTAAKRYVNVQRERPRRNALACAACAHPVSELHVRSHGDNRHRSPIAVVARVIDPLVIKRQVGLPEHGQTVVGFQDLLRSRTRQLTVAHENAQA